MKKIIRWTIGDCSKEGIDCLKKSVKNIVNFYKEKFDYYVCYNNLNKNKINKLPVRLLNQEEYVDEITIRPTNNPCWKLYPPRIKMDSYEIFIDNDLVLHKKINFEQYIKNKSFFITEAYEKSYGTLQYEINDPIFLNSGMFGIPPGFDFKKEINSAIKKFEINWNNSHFEEQAIVAYIFNKQGYELINKEQIYVCVEDIKIGKFGNHFVGLNSGFSRFWNAYKNRF
jgi:hypothetical protein